VQLATRVMKARHTGGTCPLCGRVMICGQQIALAGGVWQHAACLIAAIPAQAAAGD